MSSYPAAVRRAVAVAGLMVLAWSCLSAPAHADLAASVPEVQECVARPELGPGSQGADVRCLQYLLIMLGLPVQYTGTYDDATTTAVRWYQATHPPLHADGIAGEQTLLSLGIRSTAADDPKGAAGTSGATVAAAAASVPLPTTGVNCLADAEQKVGSQGQSVVCLQRKMTELGLYTGKATGVFDAALQNAVRAFQQSRPPLQVDGRAGPRTLAALGIWSGVSPQNSVANGTIGAAPVASDLQALPQWNMTADGIPFYGTHQACSRPDAITIATEFARDGADIVTQYWAVYIASREGGCRYDAINVNPATKDDSHCTFQINVLSGTFEPHGELGRRGWTPEIVQSSMRDCADAASDLWVFCGRGPWTPPYACQPPWEGSGSTPMAPVTVTTTTELPPDTAPVPTVPADPTTNPPASDSSTTTEPPTGTTTSTTTPDVAGD